MQASLHADNKNFVYVVGFPRQRCFKYEFNFWLNFCRNIQSSSSAEPRGESFVSKYTEEFFIFPTSAQDIYLAKKWRYSWTS